MKTSDYTSANRLAWNQAAPVHARQRMAELKESFSQPGYSILSQIERAVFVEIGIEGKAVAQLCCNNGRELLSLKNLGAKRCVGFDISEEFLAQGRELAQIAGVDCEFVRTDVYDISNDYDGAFDLIYLTIGGLCWLPDLPKFFAVIERLMAPGAWLFIYDEHPFAQVFEPDDGTDPPVVNYSYFRREPFVEESGLDYWGKTRYDSAPWYCFPHTLTDIVGGALEQGLSIQSFKEYDHDISHGFERYEKMKTRLPLCYTLTAKKTDSRISSS